METELSFFGGVCMKTRWEWDSYLQLTTNENVIKCPSKLQDNEVKHQIKMRRLQHKIIDFCDVSGEA